MNEGERGDMQKQDGNLNPLFEPRGIAILGSMRPYGEGFVAIQNMLACGYDGNIYPVSRSCQEVHGRRAYASVQDIEAPVDVAVLITPPPVIPDLVDACGRKGIPYIIVVSEGFAESGPEGAALQRQIVETARRYGSRILGPNTLGVMNGANGLCTNPYFAGDNRPPRGGVSYCSQTGLLTFGVHPLRDRGYPISKICDFGNKCDLNEVDLLSYFAADPETNVTVMHLEDIKDGAAFMTAAREAAAKKPVFVLKPGRSEAGARAVSSHTGSLAGDDKIYDSILRQAGVLRLNTWREYWEVPKALSLQPIPKGNRLAVITASGGGGVIMVDAAQDMGLVPARFAPETLRRLAEVNSRLAKNPVDVGPSMSVREQPFSVYTDVVPLVISDPNVDCAVIICHANPTVVEVFRPLAELVRKAGKPVTLFGYGVDLRDMEDSGRQMETMGLPIYFEPEMAARALAYGYAYSQIRHRLNEA